MNIRSIYTSALTAMGIACSSSAFAGTVFVHAAYVPTAVLYVPPRTLNYVPPRSLPYATVGVPIVAAPPYATVSVKTVTYAQPVMPTPVVLTR